MKGVTWARVRENLPRLAAVSIAVILSVGFVVGALALSSAFTATLTQAFTEQYEKADVVVQTDARDAAAVARAVRETAGVARADTIRSASTLAGFAGRTTAATVTALPDARVRWQKLASGRWAAHADEVTVDRSTADTFGIRIGATMTLATFGRTTGGTNTGDPAPRRIVHVVGITRAPGSVVSAGVADVTTTRAGLVPLTDDESRHASILVASAGQSPEALAAAVRKSIASAGLDSAVVQTRARLVEQRVADMTGGVDVLLAVVLVFAVVALFVAVLVISNTFSVLVARRIRELALLRCIGASAAQIRRSVYGEAFVTGLAGSVLGVGAGYGLAALASLVSGTGSAVHLPMPAVDPAQVLAGLAVGTVTTLLAAIAPARRATRVRPVEALRPGGELTVHSRRGIARLVAGGSMIAVGTSLLLLGAAGAGLAAGLPGGVVCFSGILVIAGIVIPPAVRAVGAVFSFTGVPGRLAARNATRDPHRTTAAASALLIGTTLIAMVVVGAGSVRATLVHAVDLERPVDMTVSAPAPLTDAEIDAVRRTPHVADTVVLDGAHGDIAGHDVVFVGVPARRAAEVAHAETVLPRPGELLVNGALAGRLHLKANERVIAGHPGRVFTVRSSSQVPDGTALVTPGALHTLGGQPAARQLWLRVDPALAAAGVQDLASKLQQAVPSAQIGGSAAQRAQIGRVIDTFMLVVIGLLTVAIIIAVVGIANTLALSVLERRRESALLRALGLTRGQLRGMLGMEAVLIALVAALLGVGFGVFFGWAGTQALFADADQSVVFTVPWGDLAGLTGLAAAAGLLASLLPARRAARLSPVAAMAEQ